MKPLLIGLSVVIVLLALVAGCRASFAAGAQAPGIELDYDAPKKHKTAKPKAPAPALKSPTFRKK